MKTGPVVGWYQLTASGVVTRIPSKLLRVIVLVSVAGALTSVYEGLDAASGRLIGNFTAPVGTSFPIDFAGVYCDRGLCVVLAANVTEVTVVFETGGVAPHGELTIGAGA